MVKSPCNSVISLPECSKPFVFTSQATSYLGPWFKRWERESLEKDEGERKLSGEQVLAIKYSFLVLTGSFTTREVILMCYLTLILPEKIDRGWGMFLKLGWFCVFGLIFFKFKTTNEFFKASRMLFRCFHVKNWLENKFWGLKSWTLISRSPLWWSETGFLNNTSSIFFLKKKRQITCNKKKRNQHRRTCLGFQTLAH